MKKPTTITPESVSEYREFVELCLRKRVLEAIEIVLDEELDQALGCRAYERSEERRGYRNGTETRRVTTAVGTRELRVARARLGDEHTGETKEFQSELLPRYQRNDDPDILAPASVATSSLTSRTPHHQYNLPTPKARLNYRCNREGIAEKLSDPSVFESVSSDIELAGFYDRLIKDLELFLTRKAKLHDAGNFFRLRSIPGVGKILSMTMLYEIHDIARFERVQNFASYARLVKCERASPGKRLGTGGAKIGNVHLKWAFSEAAVLFLRANPPAQRYVEKLRRKHGKAKAISILAHKLGEPSTS